MLIKSIVAITALATGFGTVMTAQEPAFEGASIKPNKTGDSQSVPQIQAGGRVTLTNRRAGATGAETGTDNGTHRCASDDPRRETAARLEGGQG